MEFQGLKLDIKSGTGIYPNGKIPHHYDCLVPAIQARKPNAADVYVFVFFDRLFLRGFIAGFATKEEVLKARLRKDLKLPAFAVKIEDIHPMKELEEVIGKIPG